MDLTAGSYSGERLKECQVYFWQWLQPAGLSAAFLGAGGSYGTNMGRARFLGGFDTDIWQGLCGFRVGRCSWGGGGVRYLFVRGLLQVLAEFAFWEWGWALSYGSMKYWDFHDTSQVFGDLWLNIYIPCLLLIIKLRFTCGENKIW